MRLATQIAKKGVDLVVDTRTLQVPLEVQFDPTPAHSGRKFICTSDSQATQNHQLIQCINGGLKR